MTVTVNLNALDKAQQKELRKVYYMLPGKPTVGQLRSFLVAGPVGMVVQTALAAAFLFGISFLFLPFIFIALLAIPIIPFKIAAANRVWNSVLPETQLDDEVVLS